MFRESSDDFLSDRTEQLVFLCLCLGCNIALRIAEAQCSQLDRRLCLLKVIPDASSIARVCGLAHRIVHLNFSAAGVVCDVMKRLDAACIQLFERFV